MSRKIAIERDQVFYGSVLSLAIPLALQSALMYSVTTLNSIMLGALGEIPMSASAIADQPFNIVSGIFRGLTLGGAILIAQYWGCLLYTSRRASCRCARNRRFCRWPG